MSTYTQLWDASPTQQNSIIQCISKGQCIDKSQHLDMHPRPIESTSKHYAMLCQHAYNSIYIQTLLMHSQLIISSMYVLGLLHRRILKTRPMFMAYCMMNSQQIQYMSIAYLDVSKALQVYKCPRANDKAKDLQHECVLVMGMTI